jgi:hypothetical protein
MKHKISHSLYSYWNEIRGERIAPRRFEIEPSRIASILPDTFIIDCGEPGSFRFRLAGTRMSQLLGRDVRDSSFFDLFQPEDRETLPRVLQQVIDQAPVTVLSIAPIVADTAPSRAPGLPEIEMLLLPLFHTRTAVTRLLGCAAPLNPMPPGRMAVPFVLALQSHETIWPDGRPHAVIEQMNRQSPFLPEHQLGRIVSSDRRRFRVFDGGKAP